MLCVSNENEVAVLGEKAQGIIILRLV